MKSYLTTFTQIRKLYSQNFSWFAYINGSHSWELFIIWFIVGIFEIYISCSKEVRLTNSQIPKKVHNEISRLFLKEERKRKPTLYFYITNRLTIRYKSLKSNNSLLNLTVSWAPVLFPLVYVVGWFFFFLSFKPKHSNVVLGENVAKSKQ